jgi:hypothetical protein
MDGRRISGSLKVRSSPHFNPLISHSNTKISVNQKTGDMSVERQDDQAVVILEEGFPLARDPPEATDWMVNATRWDCYPAGSPP